MATNTTNYNLVKPADNETADIQVINGNMDIIDSELKENSDKINVLNESLGTTNTNVTNISNTVTTHLDDYEYQNPTIVGTQIRLQKKSGTNILKFKLNSNLTGGAITISLDAGATSKPLKDVDGVALTELSKGFVEVINDVANFTLRPRGGLKIDALINEYVVSAGENINAGDLVEFVNGYVKKATNNVSADSIGQSVPWSLSLEDISAVKLDDNRILFSYIAVSNFVFAVVIKIVDGQVIVGTQTVVSNSTNYARISSVLIDDNKVLLIFNKSASTYTVYYSVLTISDTAVTVAKSATTIAVDSTTSTTHTLKLIKLDSTKVLWVYSNTSLFARVLSISDIIVTANTAVSIGAGTGSNQQIPCVQIDSSRYLLVCYRSSNISAIIFSVSDITISLLNTATLISGSMGAAYWYLDIVKLDTGKFMLVYTNVPNSNYTTAVVLTVSESNVVDKYTDFVIDALRVTCSPTVMALSKTKVLVVYSTNAVGNFLKSIVLSVSGTSISKESSSTFVEDWFYPTYTQGNIKLENDKFFVYFKNRRYDGTSAINYGSFALLKYAKNAKGIAIGTGTEGQTIKCYDWREI